MRYAWHNADRLAARGLRWSLAARAGAAPRTAARADRRAQRAERQTVQINTGRGQLVTLGAPDDRRVRRQRHDRRRPGPLADPALRLRQGGRRDHGLRHHQGAARSSIRPTSASAPTSTSIGSMLQLAMPDAQIVATPMNGLVLLTGTVAAPDDAAEAERLVQAFVGKDTQVVSRLQDRDAAAGQPAGPHRRGQPQLRQEHRRQPADRAISTGGFQFGIGQGRAAARSAPTSTLPGSTPRRASACRPARSACPSIRAPASSSTGHGTVDFTKGSAGTTLGLAGKLLGLDMLGALDLGETHRPGDDARQPNLTALSGETGTLPRRRRDSRSRSARASARSRSSTSNTASAWPTRRPCWPTAASRCASAPKCRSCSRPGAVTLNGFSIPALTTRRAETTVELGSGQSFMIAGLLQQHATTTRSTRPRASATCRSSARCSARTASSATRPSW